MLTKAPEGRSRFNLAFADYHCATGTAGPGFSQLPFAVDYPLTIAPEGRARVFVISKINIGSSIIHSNDLSSLTNEIYLSAAKFSRVAPGRSPRATSPRLIRIAKPNITSLSQFTRPPLPLDRSTTRRTSPLARVSDDGSNYIFMLFRHEVVRDCSGINLSRGYGARVRNGKCYLFVRDNAGPGRGTRNSDNEMRFYDCERVRGGGSSCLRYFVCFVHVIIVHDATFVRGDRTSRMTRGTPIFAKINI